MSNLRENLNSVLGSGYYHPLAIVLVVADTLLNYDLNETFLVQDSVLRALNQLPRYREQCGAVRARCPRGCESH